MLSSISFFFPAYNERDNVGPLVEEALAVLPKIAEKYEIIVVDDGSKDGTYEISERLAAGHPGIVRAVHNNPNRGYGGAVKRGLEEARYDWIFFTDGDRQFRLDELPSFASAAATGIPDMVLGFRKKRNDPPHRLLNAKLYGTMIKTLFRLKVRDIDCAYKLLHRRVRDAVKLESDGALVSAELLVKARNCGFKWAQIGVNHYPREVGEQTGANPKVVLRMFSELFRNYKQMKRYTAKG
jgi:glycosyltransferase involved in cell wall biosynthesis